VACLDGPDPRRGHGAAGGGMEETHKSCVVGLVIGAIHLQVGDGVVVLWGRRDLIDSSQGCREGRWAVWGWLGRERERNFPEACGRLSMAGEDVLVILGHNDVSGTEGGGTSVVAEYPNRE
jgi:hypothetical protein